MTTYQRRDIITAALAFAGVAAVVVVDLARRSPEGESISASGGPSSTVPESEAAGRSAATTTAPTTSDPPPTTSTSASQPVTTARKIHPIPVICRDAWRARPAGDGMVAHTIERLTIHHTAAAIDRVADGPGSIRSHQRFHQDDKGWADIAYHFLIDPGGNIYEGRDPSYRGDTGTEYDPAGHFLVCLEGNFDAATVNEAQRRAAVDMLAWAVRRYGVDPATLAGHRDFAETSCPGDSLYALLSDGSLVADVVSLVAAGIPELQLTCGPEGDALVEAIETSGS